MRTCTTLTNWYFAVIFYFNLCVTMAGAKKIDFFSLLRSKIKSISIDENMWSHMPIPTIDTNKFTLCKVFPHIIKCAYISCLSVYEFRPVNRFSFVYMCLFRRLIWVLMRMVVFLFFFWICKYIRWKYAYVYHVSHLYTYSMCACMHAWT